MKLLLPISNLKHLFGAVLLITLLSIGATKVTKAQNENFDPNVDEANIPHIPILSLTGNEEYDNLIYPDGRFWVPPTSGEPREFLMPVFMVNRWYSYYYQPGGGSNYAKFIADPIHSLKFSLYYNGRSIRAIGVETVPPEYYLPLDNEPLAKNFTFDVDDEPNDQYWRYLNPNKWAQSNFDEKNDGRRFTIVGTSKTPLPTTLDAEINQSFWQVLLYVKFRVIATVKQGQVDQFNRRTPIYIDPEEVRYNNVNVVNNTPTALMSDYDQTLYQVYYPAPERPYYGIRNDNMVNTSWYNLEPYKPGTIFLNIFDRLPEFGFESERAGEQFTMVEEGVWNLNLPLMVDSNSTDPGYGFSQIRLINMFSGTRLSYIEIDSDQDWLRFRTVPKGENGIDLINNFTRSYLYNNYATSNLYLDNGLIQRPDPRGIISDPQGSLWLELQADPNYLETDPPQDPKDAEKAGLYEGVVTFKSPFAGINPVKLNVTFWYYRNPFEPAFAKNSGNPGGINITMKNSNNQEIDLVFGTGHRATPGVDRLFGEATFNGGLSTTQFDARWYPTEEPYISTIPNGFADLAPNLDNPRTRSRDIRDYNASSKSHVYLCKFNNNTGGDIVLTWDINDFPANANLYIRDSYQGEFFPAANMRLTNPNGSKRSFVITNPLVDQFVIEYTLPTEGQYKDYDGNDIIKLGWNLLSLPVRPENPTWDVVFPNAINVPYYFTKNQYQEPTSGLLEVGKGFFVKYPQPTQQEQIFSGTVINRIDPDIDEVRVYPSDSPDPDDTEGSWTAIGTISTPITVDYVCFEQYGNEIPNPLFTANFGVWAYQTGKGYFEVTTMLPGLGYWIKTNANGYLRIDPQLAPCYDISDLKAAARADKDLVLDQSAELNVRDNLQREYTLYLSDDVNVNQNKFELPPVPSNGFYDVRFNSGTYLNNDNETVVTIQDAQYPLVFNIENATAEYTFSDAATGEVYGTIKKGESNSILIESSAHDAIKVQKTGAGMPSFGVQTYPNPVVDYAKVSYTVTENELVTIKLYDALGNELSTVVNSESTPAGTYTANVDASNLTSGSYIVKFIAGDKVSTAKLNVVK